MTRTMQQNGVAYRLVTKHVYSGEEVIFGPYGTLGLAKSAARKECWGWGYYPQEANKARDEYQNKQTRQFFIEEAAGEWETVPVSLVDGKWVNA